MIRQYIADAFVAEKPFTGNPAAVCVTEKWLPDSLMLQIAAENNLSETAYAVKDGDRWGLRWFTPGGEIDLCGYATLAAAFVISSCYDKESNIFYFDTLSGPLAVRKKLPFFEMDFPAYPLQKIPVTEDVIRVLGERPEAAYMGRDQVCVFKDAACVARIKPDMERMKTLDGLLVHITAPAEDGLYDCISRSFAPKLDVPEDPVCGSGHCHLVPYWSERLNKKDIAAFQASARTGVLYGRTEKGRVYLRGRAAMYSESNLFIDV